MARIEVTWLHICMVSTGSYPILPTRVGAIEPYVYGLAKKLSGNNRVDVLGLGQGELREGNLHIQTMPYVQKIQRPLSKTLDWRIAYYTPFLPEVLRKILLLHLKDPIDILHIHEVFTGYAATLSKLSLGIPYVCSLHNDVRSIAPIQTANKILAVSEYGREFLIKERKVERSKVDVLYVAVDMDSINKMDTDQAKKQLGLGQHKIILFVGRKCPEKGPQVLIKALPRIIRANPDSLAVLVGPDYIFGANFTDYTELLRKQAEELHVTDKIVFESHVSEAVKQLYYSAADVFVCPSIWQDLCPSVVKEALAFGKPVVASKVGGIPEIIEDGYTGLLVPPNDAESLAEKVNLMLGDSQYAHELVSNGKKAVEEKFDFSAIAEKCISIYLEVLG
jgi:glycosyltransferase involved in cell wall biosynthesis